MSGAVPPEHSSPVPRNAKLKKLEPRIAAARNSLDWTALSGLLQQHVTDAGRESLGGSSRQYTTAYILARIDMHVFGERDGGLVEAVKFVNELVSLTNDRVLQCIIGSVHWCAGFQVLAVAFVPVLVMMRWVTRCYRFRCSACSSCASCPRTGCRPGMAKAPTITPP